MTDLIFSTVHGSRLYGMAHSQSDHDVFTVTTANRTRARHTITENGRVDHVSVGLDTYLKRVFEGSHQAVEALFSPYKEWGGSDSAHFFRPYLEGLRITGSTVFEKYERTIKSFCYGEFKQRRHAVRLSWNLAGLRSEGRFNPVMSPASVAIATWTAEEFEGDELWKRLSD